MNRAASLPLAIARYVMIGAAVIVGFAGLLIAVGAAPLRGDLDVWLLRMAGNLATLGLLVGPIGAVLVLNALRVQAEGGSRFAFALVGVVAAFAGYVALGVAWMVADAALEAPKSSSFNNQLVAAAVFPLAAAFAAAGYLGAWSSVAAEKPDWSVMRGWIVRALALAAGCAALMVAFAMGRPKSPDLVVGAPMLVTLAALAFALAIRAQGDQGAGRLLGAVIGYAIGVFGALIASVVLDGWQAPGDPRARVLSVVFLSPFLIAGLALAAGSVVAVSGGFRAAFERARRIFA